MCKACHKESIKAGKDKLRQLKKIAEQGGKQLKDYTSRELMEELKKRGYRGKLKYTEVHEIDLESF